ncbi:MAG: hypothetical protein M1820_001207 [Bogoriella megaspora]|nr:MAG: hypothetical protein M1820_001207 [Bogoriella megaspora]
MLAIKKPSQQDQTCTPNLLPCRINHNGMVNANERHWKPELQNGLQHRRIKSLAILTSRRWDTDRTLTRSQAARARSAVLTKTERLLPAQELDIPSTDEDAMEQDPDEDRPEEVRIAEQSMVFDKFVVWGHETLPDPIQDPHIKGIQEWIAFAEKIHSLSTSSNT